eukprot:m.120700 g.120700  ORF g.120700 m.120700 type:complete len:694 (-) comp9279_c0_seq1:2297-4378(-)
MRCCAAWCNRDLTCRGTFRCVPTSGKPRARVLRALGRDSDYIQSRRDTQLIFCVEHLDEQKTRELDYLVIRPFADDPIALGLVPGLNAENNGSVQQRLADLGRRQSGVRPSTRVLYDDEQSRGAAVAAFLSSKRKRRSSRGSAEGGDIDVHHADAHDHAGIAAHDGGVDHGHDDADRAVDGGRRDHDSGADHDSDGSHHDGGADHDSDDSHHVGSADHDAADRDGSRDHRSGSADRDGNGDCDDHGNPTSHGHVGMDCDSNAGSSAGSTAGSTAGSSADHDCIPSSETRDDGTRPHKVRRRLQMDEATPKGPSLRCTATSSPMSSPMRAKARVAALRKSIGGHKSRNRLLSKELKRLKEELKTKSSNRDRWCFEAVVQMSPMHVHHLTGFEDGEALKHFMEFIVDVHDFDLVYRSQDHLICAKDAITLTLIRIRLGLPVVLLSLLYDCSKDTISRAFRRTVCLMAGIARLVLSKASKEDVEPDTIPILRNAPFTKAEHIVDCSEIFIDLFSSRLLQNQAFSAYKHHHTIKFFIDLQRDGRLQYISKAYLGGASDPAIVEHCGWLKTVAADDAILADKGFNIYKQLREAKKTRVRVLMPSRRCNDHLDGPETVHSREVSAARIHVERWISCFKSFLFLTQSISIDVLPMIDDIVSVVCLVMAFFPNLVRESGETVVDEVTLLPDSETEPEATTE